MGKTFSEAPFGPRVVDRLEADHPIFSIEFFPARNDEEEELLWRSVRTLEVYDPAFMSVTYGAGGSTRERTIRTTGRIASETTLTTMAHLTAVDHSVDELRNVIGWYAANGVNNVLALRGDPPGNPNGSFTPHPEGLAYAEELVRLVRELGDFCVGVAAFPIGHPQSPDLQTDTDYLIRKIRAGADFAVAQLFFNTDDFLRMRDRVAALGCDVPILPGVMPLTSPKVAGKAAELSGAPLPDWLSRRLQPLEHDPKSFRAAGMEEAVNNCQRLLSEGVSGLHFYTLNRAKATSELIETLGLAEHRKPNPVGASGLGALPDGPSTATRLSDVPAATAPSSG